MEIQSHFLGFPVEVGTMVKYVYLRGFDLEPLNVFFLGFSVVETAGGTGLDGFIVVVFYQSDPCGNSIAKFYLKFYLKFFFLR